MRRLFRLDFDDIATRNGWNLVIEILWAGVMASAVSFGAAFALRLGATNVQIGLLSSLPALLAVLVSLPSGQILQSIRQPRRWIFAALTGGRFGYALLALVPWLPLPASWKGLVVVGILVLVNIPFHFFNVGWLPLLAEAIPEARRAAVFSARNITYNLVVSIGTFLLGLWLDHSVFPGNYQVMFGATLVASYLSMHYLLKVQVIDHPPQPGPAGGRQALRRQWRALKEALAAQPLFRRLTLNTFFYGLGLWMVAPLYLLHYVRNLDASDGWIGLQTTVSSASLILGYLFWRPLVQRWGEPLTLKRLIVLQGLFPVLVGLLPSLVLILIAIGLNGFIASGVNLSHTNTLLRHTPPDQRPVFTALYISFVNIGAFICPLLGVALGERFGFPAVLVACGLLSVIGACSFWLWPVQSR
jgi:MFS family permease